MLVPSSPVEKLVLVLRLDARYLLVLLVMLGACWCQSCVLMTTDDIRMCDEV